jgi:short-subunit dehydrogenase
VKGKFALITGASSGIGKEFANIHASKGGNLILTARRADNLTQIATDIVSKYQVKVEIISMDLSLPESSQKLFEAVNKLNINVDYLINNAGFGDSGPFDQSDLAREIQMIDLNVSALVKLTKLFGKEMIARGSGKILNVASVAAFLSGPNMAIYFATKNFVLAFSEAIAYEWKKKGVTVTTLCPGPTQSEFFDVAGMNDFKMIKMMKLPTSFEVANYGYLAMLKGKTVAIHGIMNKIQAFLVRFMPRKWATAITAVAMGK